MSSASSPLEQTVRSGAHGFRPRRPRSLVAVFNFCRIRVNSSLLTPFSLRLIRPVADQPVKNPDFEIRNKPKNSPARQAQSLPILLQRRGLILGIAN